VNKGAPQISASCAHKTALGRSCRYAGRDRVSTGSGPLAVMLAIASGRDWVWLKHTVNRLDAQAK
jgi:hypothetical protein